MNIPSQVLPTSTTIHGAMAMWQATRVCQTRDDQRGGLEAQLHEVMRSGRSPVRSQGHFGHFMMRILTFQMFWDALGISTGSLYFFWNNPLLKSRKLRHSSEICRTRKRKLKWLGRNGRSWDRWQQNSAGDGVQWFLLRRLVEAGSMKFDQPRQFSLWSRRASREVAGTGWICWGLGRSSHADNLRHAARNPAPAQQLIALRPQYSCSARKQIEFGPACLIAFRLDLHAFIHTNDSMISYDVWQQYTALHCTALTLQCLRIITLPRIKKHVMLLLGDVRFEV